MFVIVKWWPGLPETEQPATREKFTDRTEAERIKTELQAACPGREFAVRQLVI